MRRWKTKISTEFKRFYFIATICDPRQKELNFPGVSQEERLEAHEWFEAGRRCEGKDTSPPKDNSPPNCLYLRRTACSCWASARRLSRFALALLLMSIFSLLAMVRGPAHAPTDNCALRDLMSCTSSSSASSGNPSAGLCKLVAPRGIASPADTYV